MSLNAVARQEQVYQALQTQPTLGLDFGEILDGKVMTDIISLLEQKQAHR